MMIRLQTTAFPGILQTGWLFLLLALCMITGAVSAGANTTLPPAPNPTYNPATLFGWDGSGPMPTGVLAICRAEGNCDASGNRTPSYSGHNDPGNGSRNYGWCSANTRYYPTAAQTHVADCRKHTSDGIKHAAEDMRKHGFVPEDRINMEIFINYVDLYNQSPAVAFELIETLKTFCNPGSPCSSDMIHKARVQACVKLGCNDAAGQGRRVSDIYSALTGGSIVLGDASGLSTGSTFADLKVTLVETVSFLQCWSCSIVQAVTRIADTLGNQVFSVLRESLVALLGAILGIYLVYHGMRVLLPFGPAASVAGIFGQMTLVTGMTLFVIALLGGMSFYWDYIYRPVLTGSMDASMAVLEASGVALPEACNYTGIPDEIASMGEQMSGQMTCVTRGINKIIATGTRVGWAMIVGSGALQKNEAFRLENPLTYPNFIRIILLWVSGFALMGIFIYASLAFLWVIIDIVYRWTFVSIISPLAIAAFAFRETRKFSSFATRGLLESFIALILTSVVAAITVKLIEKTGFDPRTTSGALIGGGIEQYIEALQKADPAIRAPTINTTLFWSLATIGMMTGSLMFKMKDLASYLTSSALGSWASDTGARITNLGTVLGPINQITGRLGSRIMTGHLEKRFAQKFTDKSGAKMTFTRPRYARRI